MYFFPDLTVFGWLNTMLLSRSEVFHTIVNDWFILVGGFESVTLMNVCTVIDSHCYSHAVCDYRFFPLLGSPMESIGVIIGVCIIFLYFCTYYWSLWVPWHAFFVFPFFSPISLFFLSFYRFTQIGVNYNYHPLIMCGVYLFTLNMSFGVLHESLW